MEKEGKKKERKQERKKEWTNVKEIQRLKKKRIKELEGEGTRQIGK